MIPAGALSNIVVCYKSISNEAYNGTFADVLFFIQDQKIVTKNVLEEKFGLESIKATTYLLNNGLIEKDVIIKNKTVGKEKKYYTLAISNEELSSLLGQGDSIDGFKKLRSEMHREILSILAMRERMFVDDIKAELNCTDAQISTLEKRGYIAKETESVYRNPYEHKSRVNHAKELILSDEQKNALDTLSEMLDSEKPSCALLHGVTGSGKTCVMMKIIDRALSKERGVIMLIPEISLTPQTVELFCSRYGSRVAIIHSSLSQGERLDAYMKIKRGEADLVIGTRSAIFAPIKNLGLIIIDE
jgi:primosomal protein N' (replication factor Y)